MWSIFRKRAADIAKSKKDEAIKLRSKELYKVKDTLEYRKENRQQILDEYLKEHGLDKSWLEQKTLKSGGMSEAEGEGGEGEGKPNKTQQAVEDAPLDPNYVLPKRLTPFTDHKDTNTDIGDVPPLDEQPVSYRIPDPRNPEGYDLFTATVSPRRPEKFRDLTLDTAVNNPHAPFRFFRTFIDMARYIHRSFVVSKAHAQREFFMRGKPRRNGQQFWGNIFWKKRMDKWVYKYSAEERRSDDEEKRRQEEEAYNQKINKMMIEKGLAPSKEEMDEAMKKWREREKQVQKRKIAVPIIDGKPMEQRKINKTWHPTRLVINDVLEPYLINDYPDMTYEEARELVAWDPDHTMIDALINYNVQYDMNDPLKGGSEYLQAKLYEAHMLLYDVYKEYGTIKEDEIISMSSYKEDLNKLNKQMEDKKEGRQVLTDEEMWKNTPEKFCVEEAEPENFFEDKVSPGNWYMLQEDLKNKMSLIEKGNKEEVNKATIDAWEAFWIRELNIVNEYRQDLGEEYPLTFDEFVNRMRWGESLSDKSDSNQSARTFLEDNVNWYYNANTQVPLTVMDHLEHVKAWEKMNAFFPADWNASVKGVVSMIDEIINHYLDVLVGLDIPQREVKDIDALVHQFGPIGQSIVESVKIYREDFEEEPDTALVKHVGRIYITLQNNEFLIRCMNNLSPEELELHKRSLEGTPFWDIEGLNVGEEEMTQEELDLFDWTQATILPEAGYEPEDYFSDFEIQSKVIEEYLYRQRNGGSEKVLDKDGLEINRVKVKPVHIVRNDLYGIYGIEDAWSDPLVKLERNVDLTEFEVRMVRRMAVEHETNTEEILDKLNKYIEHRSLEGKITRKLYDIEMSQMSEEELEDEDDDGLD